MRKQAPGLLLVVVIAAACAPAIGARPAASAFAAEALATATPQLTPTVPTTTGYSFLKVETARGTFSVHLIKERLSEVSVRTMTASVEQCRRDCAAKPLASYVAESGAFAAINGTYFCPPDYPACADMINTYEYAVFDSGRPQWVNLRGLFGQNALMTFIGSKATTYRRAPTYANGPAWKVPITAGISMFPLLLQDGAIVDSEAQQSASQLARNTKGAIGVDGTFVFLAVTLGASLTETAAVLRALGVRDALNLDGGGSAAMVMDGAYKVGPGRELPNAIVLTRP